MIRCLFAIAVSFCFSSFAHATFVAEEEIDYSHLSVGPANIDEAEFRRIIQQVKVAYADIVKAHGAQLAISGEWNSDTLNAGAAQLFNTWQIRISGGLARRPELSSDGFALILCHEMGHHLGGFPYVPSQIPIAPTWAANEGQADYFATQSCARKIWKTEFDKNHAAWIQSSDLIKSRCVDSWSTSEEQMLCGRILLAAQSTVATMANIKNVPLPSYETPDPNQVNQTDNAHPAVQCRMDTSLEGALCTAHFQENLIPGKNTSGGFFAIEAERQAAEVSCMKRSQFRTGLRPNCWFKEREPNLASIQTTNLPSRPEASDHPGSATYPFSFQRTNQKQLGRSVEVFSPVGAEKDRKFPVVVFGHGQAIDVEGYRLSFEHLAQKGFIVLFPQYDSGFFDQDWRRMADDYNKLIVAALEPLSEIVDRQKIIYSGHSKGAYVGLMAMSKAESFGIQPQAGIFLQPAGYDSEYIKTLNPMIPITIVASNEESTIRKSLPKEIYDRLPSKRKQLINMLSYQQTNPQLKADHFIFLSKSYFFGGKNGVSAFHYFSLWPWYQGAVDENDYLYGGKAIETGLANFSHQIERNW